MLNYAHHQWNKNDHQQHQQHHQNHNNNNNNNNNNRTFASSSASNLQPDITLLVGHPHNTAKFLAHKWVLSNHSGYFKTLFSSYDGYETQISNISSFTFAYLLTFMYTGHLELNPLNVYEIFLASNLLHVAEALNLCKQYLNEYYYHASSIVKPIPQKKFAPPNAYESIRTLAYQPLRPDDEPSSSIFKPVLPTTVSHERRNENETAVNNGKKEVENSLNLSRLSEYNLKRLGPTSSTNNVILDIACCDGPIKFHKITNQYYDPAKAMAINRTETASDTDTACNGCKYVFKHYHKRSKKYPQQQDENFTSHTEQTIERCSNLSFAANAATTNVDSKFKKKQENQQCYSCKTCGSKFPSYYFVHKHRKLHHHDGREETE